MGMLESELRDPGPGTIWAIFLGDASPDVTQYPGLPTPGVWG